MYRIRLLDAAIHELARLDKPVGRRIVERIRWLAANLEDIKPEAFTGNLAGLYKLRVVDYRVRGEQTIRISWIPFSFRLSNKEESEGFIYATDSRSKGGLKLTPFQIMAANHYHNKDTRLG